ncbi:MAG TPA: 3-hydroxyacyl-CoA dehydrogenase [Planctomycetaceae bacterium]|nr:3-hydroxyacyl-CoA dehydrogenase [Planctomycetaceae bacterium]
MDIAGRSFLVTGGGSGLGEATVRRLVAGGARVVIADINQQLGQSLAKELGEARFVATDVTDEASVRSAIKVAVDTFGDFRGVVNCAGIASAVRVISKDGPHDLGVFNRMIQVNLIGTFNVIRLAAEVISKTEPMEGGERGVIVNTASVAAYDGQIGQAAYSASKGGVVAMTLPVARELAKFGIRVMTIVPGLFDTPLMQSLPEEAKKSLGQQVPFPSRLGYPSEFAALVQHICENQMLNGEAIRLDGAIRMAPK